MELRTAIATALERASLTALRKGSQTAWTTVTLMARATATWKELERVKTMVLRMERSRVPMKVRGMARKRDFAKAIEMA